MKEFKIKLIKVGGGYGINLPKYVLNQLNIVKICNYQSKEILLILDNDTAIIKKNMEVDNYVS